MYTPKVIWLIRSWDFYFILNLNSKIYKHKIYISRNNIHLWIRILAPQKQQETGRGYNRRVEGWKRLSEERGQGTIGVREKGEQWGSEGTRER